MLLRPGVILLVAVVMLVISFGEDLKPVKAYHAYPWPDYVYWWTMYDLYPQAGRDRNVAYSHCGAFGTESQKAINDWVAKFNKPQPIKISATNIGSCVGTAEFVSWVASDGEVDQACQPFVGALACAKPYGPVYDSENARWVFTKTDTVYRYSWMVGASAGQRQHAVAHEFGHMMGLADHPETCQWVMGGAPCSTKVTGADIGTVHCIYNYPICQ